MRTLCLVGSLALSATAQTYIVSSTGGGDFLEIHQAIAAVPSGATLRVRAGSYSAFTIANKSITIVADSSWFEIRPDSGTVTIGPLQSVQYVRVVGLAKGVVPWWPNALSMVLRDCAGSVVLDSMRFSSPSSSGVPGGAMTVDSCANVHIARAELDAWTRPPLPAGALVVRGSCVEITDSRIEGPSGTLGVNGVGIWVSAKSTVSVTNSSITGSLAHGVEYGGRDGGDGVLVDTDSTLELSRCNVHGGRGGMNSHGSAFTNGGNGVVVSSRSNARIYGSTLLGGAPGQGTTGSFGQSGKPLVVDATSRATHDPATQMPHAALVGNVSSLSTVALTLYARRDALALLLLDQVGSFTVLPELSFGALMVPPTYLFGPFTVPGSGTLIVPWTVPPAWPFGKTLHWQFVTLDVVTLRFEATNSFLAIARQ